MKRMNIYCVLLVFGCFSFAGCSTVKVKNMVTERTSFGVQHSATVAVSAEGGSSSVQWFSGTISPEAFGDAVNMSLEKSGLFKGLVDKSIADYVLNVVLTYAGSHPGFTMHAWVTAKWDLVERASGEKAWSAEIKGDGSASVGDAFSGAKRQYMALERSAKANIEEALSQIGKLRLKDR